MFTKQFEKLGKTDGEGVIVQIDDLPFRENVITTDEDCLGDCKRVNKEYTNGYTTNTSNNCDEGNQNYHTNQNYGSQMQGPWACATS